MVDLLNNPSVLHVFIQEKSADKAKRNASSVNIQRFYFET